MTFMVTTVGALIPRKESCVVTLVTTQLRIIV